MAPTPPHIDLVLLGEPGSVPEWPLGSLFRVAPEPEPVFHLWRDSLSRSTAQAFLFWDIRLGNPDPGWVQARLDLPGNLWHAGLRQGMSGRPRILDFIHPTWMFAIDPDIAIEASSWRLSLGACLVQASVLEQVGFLDPDYCSLAGAGLEWGYRCLKSGVLVRHVPDMVSARQLPPVLELPLEDELRFARRNVPRRWLRWAAMRGLLTGYLSPAGAARLWQGASIQPPPLHFQHPHSAPAGMPTGTPQVTVLIPTLDRYEYLRTLLSQLRQQTIPPAQVIVVDQNPPETRQPELYEAFSDLPLQVLYQDHVGQCSARNAGLQVAMGEYVLFLDDDDEIPASLVEQHLANLHRFKAQVSCGVADEVGAGSLPEDFRYIRLSDVFPTNNAMLRRAALESTGFFDLAYDRGRNEDGDLGMRLYLSGALMVLDPSICVLHHHAPRGGLRSHGERAITYASSRQRLDHRNIPSPSEIYLAMRYFSPAQVGEMLWIAAFSSLSLHGSGFRRALKVVIGLLYLPGTLRAIRRNKLQAEEMLLNVPQIPKYSQIPDHLQIPDIQPTSLS